MGHRCYLEIYMENDSEDIKIKKEDEGKYEENQEANENCLV